MRFAHDCTPRASANVLLVHVHHGVTVSQGLELFRLSRNSVSFWDSCQPIFPASVLWEFVSFGLKTRVFQVIPLGGKVGFMLGLKFQDLNQRSWQINGIILIKLQDFCDICKILAEFVKFCNSFESRVWFQASKICCLHRHFFALTNVFEKFYQNFKNFSTFALLFVLKSPFSSMNFITFGIFFLQNLFWMLEKPW